MIPVKIEKVTIDTLNNRFIVILKDEKGRRWLPIVVGPAEAQAIALRLEKVNPPRPLSHDLMKNLLDSMETSVDSVAVTKLEDNTYYAVITLSKGEAKTEIDARPSDGIALALRTGAPVLVAEAVMDKAAIHDDLNVVSPGDASSGGGERDKLAELEAQLAQAVKEERYEDAATIRDQINELKDQEDSRHN